MTDAHEMAATLVIYQLGLDLAKGLEALDVANPSPGLDAIVEAAETCRRDLSALALAARTVDEVTS